MDKNYPLQTILSSFGYIPRKAKAACRIKKAGQAVRIYVLRVSFNRA